MNNYRRAKLLSAQTKMVSQMMGLHWWKSIAKWEAEQSMEDCIDYSTPQSSIYSGCTEIHDHGEYNKKEPQARGKYHAATELLTTGVNGPTCRKTCSKYHSSNKRLQCKKTNRQTTNINRKLGTSDTTTNHSTHSQPSSEESSQSTSSSSSQSTSSDDSKDCKSKKAKRRDEQYSTTNKQKFCTIYANWIQETSK